jgi:hypothetical protein
MLVKKISISCEEIGEKYDMSDVRDVPKSSHKKGRGASQCPSINGYFVQSLRYAQILILEILQYIHPKGTYFVAPPVKIFACLDIEQNISFLDGH